MHTLEANFAEFYKHASRKSRSDLNKVLEAFNSEEGQTIASAAFVAHNQRIVGLASLQLYNEAMDNFTRAKQATAGAPS